MGGDRAPAAIVEGVVHACRDGFGPVILVGDEVRVRAALQNHAIDGLAIEVIHADEAIGMAEHPGRAARTKRQSSMHLGYGLVKNGQASSMVSAGNSGAMMAVGLLTLRRLPQCSRPAFVAAIPTQGKPTVLLDLGANIDCRATHLVQFALMGAAYAEIQLNRKRPTVALLSNGTEPTKGTETLREAHRLLAMTDLNYIGFVEGRRIPRGDVDVVVTDGFVGNIMLKLAEGVTTAILERIRTQLQSDWIGRLGAMLIKRSLRGLRDELDWSNIGGAPLLGLNGIALIAHGNSDSQAIYSAIRMARTLDQNTLIPHLRDALTHSDELLDHRTSTSELPITQPANPELSS